MIHTAIIYARHSTDKQNPKSTEDQIAECMAFCRRHGFTVRKVFADEERSGEHSGMLRPGFCDLVNFLKSTSGIDYVICEDLSRISRSLTDTSAFWDTVNFLDIKLHSISEGDINELFIGFKGTMNALYIKDLRHKTKRGQRAAIARGKMVGKPPYGYRINRRLDEKGELVRGEWKIEEKEADTIRKIFERYLSGYPLSQICDELNRDGVPTPKGKKWLSSVLVGTYERKTGLLRQSLYNGVLTYNKMEYRKNPDTGKRLSFVRPQSEWLYQPTPELRIVTEKTFLAAQKMLDNRSSVTKERKDIRASDRKDREFKYTRKNRPIRTFEPRKKNLHIFSGLIFCHHHDKRIKPTRVNSYACSENDCKIKGWTKPALTDAILSKMSHFDTNDIIKSGTFIKAWEERQTLINEKNQIKEKLKDYYRHFPKKPSETLKEIITELERDISKIDRKILKKSAVAPDKNQEEEARTRFKKTVIYLVKRFTDDPANEFLLLILRKVIARVYFRDTRQVSRIDYDIEALRIITNALGKHDYPDTMPDEEYFPKGYRIKHPRMLDARYNRRDAE